MKKKPFKWHHVIGNFMLWFDYCSRSKYRICIYTVECTWYYFLFLYEKYDILVHSFDLDKQKFDTALTTLPDFDLMDIQSLFGFMINFTYICNCFVYYKEKREVNNKLRRYKLWKLDITTLQWTLLIINFQPNTYVSSIWQHVLIIILYVSKGKEIWICQN